MGQVKIYGLAKALDDHRTEISDVIHSCVTEALKFPADKRFHRFFPMQPSDFIYPAGRSDRYVIVEIHLFEGRSVDAKKMFYRLMYQRFNALLGVDATDLEIIFIETPRHNWGIRGVAGDELVVDYQVNV